MLAQVDSHHEIALPRAHNLSGGYGPISVYTAGKNIYHEGDPAMSLYEIKFGCVRVYRILADGRRQICAFQYAGETFGLEPNSQHQFFAEAVVATGIRRLPRTSNDQSFPDVLTLALRSLARANAHLMILARQGACERVAAFILDTAERRGGLESFDLPMSRADIGDYLGLTIETVSRALSKFKQSGLVRFPTLRTIEIMKRTALEMIAE